MFGIGANELIIILLFGFLIFGPDKMPAMAKTIGKAIARFRTAQEEMNNVIRNEVYDPNSDDPFANPLDALSKVEKKVTREDRGESFTERKARYDKQRAAKKAAEQAQAQTNAAGAAEKVVSGNAGAAGAGAAAAGVASKAAADGASASATGKAAADGASSTDSKPSDSGLVVTESAEDTSKATSKPTADELYGVTPRTRKPSVKKVPVRKPVAPISTKSQEPELKEASDVEPSDVESADIKSSDVKPSAEESANTETPSSGEGKGE